MDDKNKLLEFVRQQILKSHPRHRIFEFLYPEFFESAELSSRISVFKWLHYVEKNEEEKVPQEYLLALQIICREFPKAKKAFKPQICPAGYSCQLNILSDRYALDSQYLSAKEFKLFLYDNFYGKRRCLKGNGEIFHFHDVLLISIDLNYLLLISNRFYSGDHDSTILLLKLDVASSSFKSVDMQTAPGGVKLILDTNDRRKFIIFSTDSWERRDYIRYLCRGSVFNDKLNLEQISVAPDLKLFPRNIKLLGNKLYGLEKENKDGQEKLFYRELNIDSNQMKDLCEVEKDPTIEMESGVRRQYFTHNTSTWINDVYYFFNNSSGDKLLLLKFDTNDGKISAVKKLETISADEIADVRIIDGQLICCTHNSCTKHHKFHRAPLGQPEKLLNLTMAVIKQRLVFVSDEKRKALAETLPPRMRAFQKWLLN